MAKPHAALAPIPGVDDLYSLIEFLGNEKEYKKQLDLMKDLRKELTNLIEKVGKVNEITGLHQAALVAKAKAERSLLEAQTEAHEIGEKATVAIDKEKETFRKRTQETNRGLKTREDNVAALEVTVVGREESVGKKEAAVEKREAASKHEMEAAQTLRKEFEEKARQMKSLVL